MAFVTQEDVFAAIEPVLAGAFEEFAAGRTVTKPPFPRITFADSMLKYGNDKPDLRNPIVMSDATEIFRGSGFGLFAKLVDQGAVVRAVPAPGASAQPRSFFDKLNDWARAEDAGGLGYMVFEGGGAKGLRPARNASLAALTNAPRMRRGFLRLQKRRSENSRWRAPHRRGIDRSRRGPSACWVVDFPMHELNEDTKKIEFSHNRSMPQGGLDAERQDLLKFRVQHDIVCNGIELSSGAIRNHSRKS